MLQAPRRAIRSFENRVGQLSPCVSRGIDVGVMQLDDRERDPVLASGTREAILR